MSTPSMAVANATLAQARARATQRYQQTQAVTVTPGHLVIMLYDGALRFLRRARLAIADQQIEAAHHALCRAQEILAELDTALDDSAGPIATSLHQIYGYCYQRLVEANMQKDTEGIGEVIAYLEQLSEAWRTAVQQNDGAGKAE